MRNKCWGTSTALRNFFFCVNEMYTPVSLLWACVVVNYYSLLYTTYKVFTLKIIHAAFLSNSLILKQRYMVMKYGNRFWCIWKWFDKYTYICSLCIWWWVGVPQAQQVQERQRPPKIWVVPLVSQFMSSTALSKWITRWHRCVMLLALDQSLMSWEALNIIEMMCKAFSWRLVDHEHASVSLPVFFSWHHSNK
jgi:hypothetical protein